MTYENINDENVRVFTQNFHMSGIICNHTKEDKIMKKIKKYSLLLVVTIVAVLCLALSASAAWEKVSENSNIEYHFDDVTGTLYIRGEGKIPDDFLGRCGKRDYDDEDEFDYDDFEITQDFSYLQKVKTLMIEDGITEIGHCAFLGKYRYATKLMSELRTVVLPDSLETIGNYAFANCNNLKKVIMGDNLKKIGEYAFYKTAVSSINFSDGLETISDYAFYGAGVSKLVLPETLKTIGDYAFYGTKVKNVYIPESVTELSSGAFDGCNSLKKITFTNAVCQMDWCDSLEEIVYPADFTNYNKNSGYIMAANCPKLKKITFPSIEKEHNIKIPTRSYSAFVKNCPKVKLGYVNFDMIKNLYIEYEVKTKSVSKLGKVTGVKHVQKGNDNKLVWNAVEGAGYYHVSHWNSTQKKWERVYGGADTYTTCISDGKYKVRAVNYDGEKYVYGSYSAEVELHTMCWIDLRVAEKGETSVKLKWSNTAGQTGYQLYYSTSKNSGYKKVVDTTKYSYTVKNLEKGKTYYFKVRRYYKYADGNIAYGPFDNIVKVTL